MTIEERNKLVVDSQWVARKVMQPYIALKGVDYEEMKSNALAFMTVGADKFDPNRGVKPSTYLYNWAYAGVMDYLYTNRNVRIPRNRINQQIQINRKIFNGIDMQTGFDVKNQKSFVHTEIHIDQGMNSNSDEKVISKNNRLHYDMLKSLTADPNNVHAQSDLADHISYVVNKEGLLSNIEKFTIIHRMGLEDGVPKKHREIASLTATDEQFKERKKPYTIMGICKAEKRALAKLRSEPLIQDALI